MTSSVVYQATVTRNDAKEEKTYVGHTEGEFKTRYNGHTSFFRNSTYKHATELIKYVWHLKESSVKYSIKWRIMKKCKSYSNKTKRCNLCLHEKFLVIYYPKLSSLNSRNELLSKCRHLEQIPVDQ
jgi:YHS domain-containing protein